MGHKNLPNIKNVHECNECKIPKGWGFEIIIENNDMYCGKILNFKKGAKFSMHYHLIKDETWYVESGEFIYKWIDTNTAELHEKKLTHGDVVRQLVGQPHQLIALTDGAIFEVSTTHFDEDSYRVYRGDSQKDITLDDNVEDISNTNETTNNDRGHVYYTLGNKQIDLRQFDYSFTQIEVEQKFGWEACMYYSNIHHKELDNEFFHIEKGDVFLDLGANIGMSATYAELKGASKIYAIEPDPNIYECLLKNKGSNWVVDNVGISDHDGFFEMGYWPNTENRFMAEALTLDSFFNKHGIEKVDYLKMDVEGSERNIIMSTSQHVWDKVEKMFIEYHEDVFNYSDEKRGEFVDKIRSYGFINSYVIIGQTQSFMYFWK